LADSGGILEDLVTPILEVAGGEDAENREKLFAIAQEIYKRCPHLFKSFFVDDGVAFNSPIFDDQPTPEAKKTIAKWLEERGLGKGTVNYRLRDWLFSRQRYWGEPFPVIQTEDGQYKLVPEAELPVALPEMADFKPTGTMDPPLSKAKEWLNTKDPETGKPARREVNTMPQWAGSCWYYLRFLDALNAKQAWSKEAEAYWMPIDLYVGGAEHAVLHLLYARFWHKVLHDCGLVHTKEPFQKLFNQGLITSFAYKDETGRLLPVDEVETRVDGKGNSLHIVTATGLPAVQLEAKMSKALKNVVNPDDVIGEYGADTLRLYEMFMGPLDSTKPWNPRDVPGVYRFLQRAWRIVIEDNESKPEAGQARTNLRSGERGAKSEEAKSQELERSLHKTIKKVTEDLDRMAFNTAISALMVFSNDAFRELDHLTRSQAERFVQLLAPFAPHLAEELWARLGHDQSLAYEPWPTFDAAMTVDATVELAVQVNGKVRGRVSVAADMPDEAIKKLAQETVAKELAGKTVQKVIVIKGRLVSIVAK
jgi:leucyl-tRNA synthetase